MIFPVDSKRVEMPSEKTQATFVLAAYVPHVFWFFGEECCAAGASALFDVLLYELHDRVLIAICGEDGLEICHPYRRLQLGMC